jgi:uncharacterized protein DUF6941
MPASPRDWQVVLLLCDAAQEIGGKLYILGGGWSKLYRANQPAFYALAVRIAVPWNEANQRHKFVARLVTDEGQPFEIDGKKIEFSGGLEVGRPPGAKIGSRLDSALAVNVEGLPLPAGNYVWELEIDGTVMADAEFQVMSPPVSR